MTLEIFRFGAGYVDDVTGVKIVGYHPLSHPQKWKDYVAGAQDTYRARKVSDDLAWRHLADGKGVSLFFLAYNEEGEIVGGVRFHGPLASSRDAAFLREMRTSSEINDITEVAEAAIKEGVLEMKGMWSKGAKVVGAELASTLIRTALVAMRWLDVPYVYATGTDRFLPMKAQLGPYSIANEAVAFPDERYSTLMYVFSREISPTLCDEEYRLAYESDVAQIISADAFDGIYGEAYQALVLDPSVRSENAVLSMLRKDPYLEVLDHYEAQVAQLKSSAGSAGIAHEQRWAWYPWARTLVSVLEEDGFVALRTDRNHNKITRDEQYQLRGQCIGVVGASAGHAAAYAVAMEGLAKEIRLADFDSLELSNLNRIAARVLDLGVNKAVVCARRIVELDPYISLSLWTEGVTDENLGDFLHGVDLVVEECDSLDVKMRVREVARAMRIPVVMETSDRGTLDVERFDLEPERELFHGRLGETSVEDLRQLSLAARGPYLARLIGVEHASARGVASLLELGFTLSGWPQLGSEVQLGGASIAAAVRRFGTGKPLASGRVRVDLEEALDHLEEAPYENKLFAGLATPPPEDIEPETDDVATLLVDAARRAPSGGNVQPWRFEIDNDEVRFFLVPERSDSAMDIRHRGSYVGLGAAVLNVRARASALGVLGATTILPEGQYSHLVARMELGSSCDIDLAQLSPHIAERAANRRQGRREEISDETSAWLHDAVSREGGRLRLVSDVAGLAEGAKLLGEADRSRFLLSHIHQQMMHELRWPGRDRLDDGLDVRTLELGAAGYFAFELLGRSDVMAELGQWRQGSVLGMSTQMQVSQASALALVTVPRGGIRAWMRGGMALERFWLEATRLGLSVVPCAPVYVYADNEEDLLSLGGERHVDALAAQRTRLRSFFSLSGSEAMIMALRVFCAEAPSVHSIRRPLSEVLSHEQ